MFFLNKLLSFRVVSIWSTLVEILTTCQTLILTTILKMMTLTRLLVKVNQNLEHQTLLEILRGCRKMKTLKQRISELQQGMDFQVRNKSLLIKQYYICLRTEKKNTFLGWKDNRACLQMIMKTTSPLYLSRSQDLTCSVRWASLLKQMFITR